MMWLRLGEAEVTAYCDCRHPADTHTHTHATIENCVTTSLEATAAAPLRKNEDRILICLPAKQFIFCGMEYSRALVTRSHIKRVHVGGVTNSIAKLG